jgi:quinol monooxygenase YgiN
MEVTILLEIQVAPENVEEVKKIVQEMLPETRLYDGCISLYAIQNLDDPGNVVLVQKWQSREHYERYLAWRAETRVSDAMVARAEVTYNIRYFETLDA